MKGRCLNPNNTSYPDYGGRGIEVCERWLHSFENFLADMGERPTGMTLDRKSNDGNYTKRNCRWATRKRLPFSPEHCAKLSVARCAAIARRQQQERVA
jgi:hypothetical protein